MRRDNPRKRAPGPHMIQTEALDLDEALEIIRTRQRVKRQKKPATLREELGRNKLRQHHQSVSLSDRTAPAMMEKFRRPSAKKPDVVWTAEEVRKAHATGMFKTSDLSSRAKVSILQIAFWVYGTAQPPVDWKCPICKKANSSTTVVSHGYQPMCCGHYWYDGLRGE